MVNSKCQKLKEMLDSESLEYLMECHSGLSAVIAEEAGFKGLWASGLSVSAMTGCRDRNELDTSEVCKIIEQMADHTSLPILVDGDTGGVDVNAARILVNKLTKVGAAGVCIEDKVFPKHNSFHSNGLDDLSDPALHCKKIEAMKKENPDFVVIARLEEFIAGAGLQEAYVRALKYQTAGADAILVHSKIKDSSEIDQFMELWSRDKKEGKKRVPIVIVPTKYYTTPTQHFEDIGVSLVIFANHQVRASIKAMQDVTRQIFEDKSLVNVESKIASVSEVFRLQRDNDSFVKETSWKSSKGKAVIISANKIVSLGEDTVINRQIDSYRRAVGVDESQVYVVLGEKSDSYLVNSNCNVCYNLDWRSTSEVSSIDLGLSQINFTGECEDFPIFISYGDLVFKDTVFRNLNYEKSADIVFVADSSYETILNEKGRYNENLLTNDSLEKLSDSYTVRGATVKGVDYWSDHPVFKNMIGTFSGVVMVNTYKGLLALKAAIKDTNFSSRFIEVINKLCQEGINLKAVLISKEDYVDIDSKYDEIRGRFLSE